MWCHQLTSISPNGRVFTITSNPMENLGSFLTRCASLASLYGFDSHYGNIKLSTFGYDPAGN